MTITFPNPSFLSAPAPTRQGVVHEFFYTGEVSKPVWFSGRHLWRVRFVYGETSAVIAEGVKRNMSMLLEAGEAEVPIPFAYDGTVFSKTGNIIVNHVDATITFPGTFSASDITRLAAFNIQIGRYCLYPLGATGADTIRFLNIPDDLTSGSATVEQGQGVYKLLVRPAIAAPPDIININPKRSNVRDDIVLVEVV